MAATDLVPARLDLVPVDVVRWVRLPGEFSDYRWVLAGPEHLMIEGDTVKVLKASGWTEEVEVGEIIGQLADGRWAAYKAEGVEPARWVRMNGAVITEDVEGIEDGEGEDEQGRKDGVWVVCGHGLAPGRIVTVKSASRGMSRVRIGGIVDHRDGYTLALPDTPVERPRGVVPVPGRVYRRRVDGKLVKAYRSDKGVYGKVFNERTGRYEYAGLAFEGGIDEVDAPVSKRPTRHR